MRLGSRLVGLVLVGFLASCTPPAQPRPWRDPSPHRVLHVAVEGGVHLEVLDWGGRGPAIVFLAGLGDTGHSFDEFAPRFRDSFHPIAITRRGFGASSHPDRGYDSATRARDILVVMDSLHIDWAMLVGHSVAGDELSHFAITYPQRVRALVYLDAYSYGSDWTNPGVPDAPYPEQDRPIAITAADSASVESVTAYMEKVFGVRMPRAEVLFEAQFGPDGKLVRFPAPSAASQVLSGTDRSDYSRIEAPALGIFALSNSVEELFPNFQTFDEENRRMAQEWSVREQRRTEWQIGRFRDELRSSIVVEIPHANHYVHFSHAHFVECVMRAFLSQSRVGGRASASE